MLDAWIIDELQRRERRLRDERAHAELPLFPPELPPDEAAEGEAERGEDADRGVAVVDFRV
ncbi:MAG: hypothetical protein IPL40_16490 [Proteobacteria bacterium]|nr:hypothetical protein [Pseudomonadota bacterium]